MGASGKWVKALIGFKKPDKDEQHVSYYFHTTHKKKFVFLLLLTLFGLCLKVKEGGKSKKWRLWRSSSGDNSSWKGFKTNHHKAASEGSESPTAAQAYTAAVATVVRAQPKDFRLVRQEWAAIRIQTTFRAFLVFNFFNLQLKLLFLLNLCFCSFKSVFLFLFDDYLF